MVRQKGPKPTKIIRATDPPQLNGLSGFNGAGTETHRHFAPSVRFNSFAEIRGTICPCPSMPVVAKRKFSYRCPACPAKSGSYFTGGSSSRWYWGG